MKKTKHLFFAVTMLIMTAMLTVFPSAVRAESSSFTPITRDTTNVEAGQFMGVFNGKVTGTCIITLSENALMAGVAKMSDTNTPLAMCQGGNVVKFRCEADTAYFVVVINSSASQMVMQHVADTTLDLGTVSDEGTSGFSTFTPTVSGNYSFDATPSSLIVALFDNPGGAPSAMSAGNLTTALTAGSTYYVVCATQTEAEVGQAVSVNVSYSLGGGAAAVEDPDTLHVGDTIVDLTVLGLSASIDANYVFTPTQTGSYIIQLSNIDEYTRMMGSAKATISSSDKEGVDYFNAQTSDMLLMNMTAETPYYFVIGQFMGDALNNVTITVRPYTPMEAKAVYTESNHTLTFCKPTGAVTGDTVFVVDGFNCPWNHSIGDGYALAYHYNVDTVVFDASFAECRPFICANWFRFMDKLKVIRGIENLNTSEVVDMTNMFRGCEKLQTLDLSGFNTANVTDMECMFHGCTSLQSLTLGSNFSTANVKYMGNMFDNCEKLQSLDLSSFNTAKVVDMTFMFNGCRALQSLTLGSNFSTANVTDMMYMFGSCNSLQSLDLSNFNTANVTDMYGMFDGCKKLQTLNLSSFNTEKVTTMKYMFEDCYELPSLNLSSFNTAKVTNMSGMFSHCDSLKTLTLGSNFSTANVTDMDYMFRYCQKLQSIDLSHFNTEKVTTMYEMFEGCNSLQSLDLSSFNTTRVESMNFMFKECESLKTLDLTNLYTLNVTGMMSMFQGCTSLQSLTFGSNFHTDSVKTMFRMFEGCKSLKSLDLHTWNVEKTKEVGAMFENCDSLHTLNLSGWNLAEATSLNSMFYQDKQLKNLDLSGWKISNVLNMNLMFYECDSLRSVDLSGWATESLRNVYQMFYGCDSLKSVNLSGWNTTNLMTLQYMFEDCQALQTIDLSGWDLPDGANMVSMFANCLSLKTLTLGNFNMSGVDDRSIFYGVNSVENLIVRSYPNFSENFAAVNWQNVKYELDDNSIITLGTIAHPVAATMASTYKREMSNAWGTVVVPFAITYSQSNGNYKLYRYTAATVDAVANTGTLTFTEYDDQAVIPAGTPMIIKAVGSKNAETGKYNVLLTANGNDINTTINAIPAVDGLTLEGTYEIREDMKCDAGADVYFIAKNKFWKAVDGITIHPFRAWFMGSIAAAPARFDIVEGEQIATAVEDILSGADKAQKALIDGKLYILRGDRLYDLNGRLVR